jgi:transcriptional regulator with XRE-family HTH domain
MKRLTSRSYPTLKHWRDAAELTQREAADFLGISQSFYNRLEQGLQAAHGKNAKRITERTGVPLEILVGAA